MMILLQDENRLFIQIMSRTIFDCIDLLKCVNRLYYDVFLDLQKLAMSLKNRF